jgi:hypothetical protein
VRTLRIHHIGHNRLTCRERAGFVKGHNIDLGSALEV